MKRCARCKVEKPLTEFSRYCARADGRHYYCAECKRSAERAWRLSKHEAEKERVRLYRARPSVRHGIRERARRWATEHRDRIRKYAQSERGKLAFRKSEEKRRAAKLGTATAEVDFRNVYARDGGRCWICWRSISLVSVHFDHVIPLAKGGSHTEENLRVACGPCNRRKKDALPTPAVIARIHDEVLRLTA